MVGTGFPYAEWLPEPGQARAVQVDIDGRRVGIRYPTEVDRVGDAREPRGARRGFVEPKPAGEWRGTIESGVAAWWRLLEERAHQSANPLNPQLVFHELSPRLPDGAILTADSGSATNWWARHL